MKSKFSLILLAATFLISGCTTYKEYNEDSFSNFTWESGQTIVFKPTIEDITTDYRLGFGLRHVYGMSTTAIKITVKSVSPSGNATMDTYPFQIKEADGSYVGSCAGDMCDLEAFVDNEIRFMETGEYTFMLSHNSKISLAGVTALGLIIDKK